MLTYDLTNRGEHPLYEYLYICIRNDIVTGVLKAGEKLPSKRMLSRNLSISVITVENAYEQLIMEGYIRAEEKRGYFVAEIEQSGSPQKDDSIKQSGMAWKTSMPRQSDKARPDDRTADGRNVQVSEGERSPRPLIDFSSNQTVYNKFPFSVWARLTRQTLLDEEHTFLKSPMSRGEPVLRQAIASYLKEFRGMIVDPENIVIGAGTEYLYGIVVQLLGRNGMIAVEDPGHMKVTRVYESNGVKVLHIPIDESGFSIDALGNNQVSAIHISPSHHFPTGIVMPAVRRHKILSYAAQKDCYVIEDDYDSEFRFSGRPILTMASLGGDRVIYMNTFSKTLAASVRIAYMVLPDALMERYRTRLTFYSSTVCSTEQYTLARFISEGYYGRHINRARNFYREYRKEILEAIGNSALHTRAAIEEHNAGLHFILKITMEQSDEEFLQRLEEAGVRLASVSSYCYRPREMYQHQFLINYSNVTPEEMRRALAIIEDVASWS